MELNRRGFVTALGLAAVAGVSKQAKAAGELNKVHGRTFEDPRDRPEDPRDRPSKDRCQ